MPGKMLPLCFILFVFFSPSFSAAGIKEDFNTLDSWQPLYFPKIKKHTVYSIINENGNNILKCEADASASGLLYKNVFNIRDYPVLKWRWKISNVYKKGNASKREGDDYPLRIYVVFKYNPIETSFLEKTKYKAAKLVYGEYPPHSTLNYIWANKEHDSNIITNPFTEKARMIIMETGSVNIGKWIDEKVNIMDDYRKAFGEDPPAQAGIAVMSDADNTGEKSVSFLDYVELTAGG